MNKNLLLLGLFILSLLVTACGTSSPELPRVTQSPTIATVLPSPIPTQTPVYSTAPEDQILDQACRITIDFFFSIDKDYTIDIVRSLFTPASQYHVGDDFILPEEPSIILELAPASEWWRNTYPGEPMPGFLTLREENEYVYYVKYTFALEPNSTPIVPLPDAVLFYMVVDGPESCKIKGYGW